jgi:hypothetical protein
MTTATMRPADIKSEYNSRDNGHFFDRDTMRFFGDTMRSFGVCTIDGSRYLYRKPSAIVNVFGTRKRAGRDYFNAWLVTDDFDLDYCDNETIQRVYNAI